MKILQKGQMPDGTPIQRENWHFDYGYMAYGATVAAYPIAKVSIRKPFAPQQGERFRAQFDFGTPREAEQCYKQLESGEKTLKDFADKIWYPDYAVCL